MKKIFLILALLFTGCSVDSGEIANNSTRNNTIVMAECNGDQVDGDELCDGDNLNDNTCISLGFAEGTLVCKRDCLGFDLSACGAPETCGNGQLDKVEFCDGEDLAGVSCQSLGLGEGAIFCEENCLGFDTSICAIGLECEPQCPGQLTCERGVCVGPLTELVLNEVGFNVAGLIEVEGESPVYGDPSVCNEAENARVIDVIFIEPTLGYRVQVEIECKDQFTFQTRLPIGTYEVRLRAGRHGRQAKINLFDVEYLVQNDLKIDKDISNLILNEVGFEVSGNIQVEGKSPVLGNSRLCRGSEDAKIIEVIFTEPTLGYRVVGVVECQDNFVFQTRLPEGTYEVRLRHGPHGWLADMNLFGVEYLVQKNLIVGKNLSNLIFNETGFDLSGKIQVEEQPPVYGDPTICDEFENARVAEITFIEPTLGYRAKVEIECSHDFVFETRLPIGTYEVRLGIGPNGRQAQINLFDVDYLALKNLKIDKNISNLFLNEVGFDVSGKIQVEGQPPVYGDPTTCTDFENAKVAEVIFTETTLGYRATAEIECKDNFTFQTRLPIGTYEVRLRRGRNARQTEINLFDVDYLVQKDLTIDKDTPNLSLNEVGFDVSGKIQVEGQSPVYGDPTVCTDSETAKVAQVVFIESTLGYRLTTDIECKDNFTFQTRVPIGNYEIRLLARESGRQAQINLFNVEYLVQENLEISMDTENVILNEVGLGVSGEIQVDGKSPIYGKPEFCKDPLYANEFVARLDFTEPTKGYRNLIGITCADDFAFNASLPVGTYEVRLIGQNVRSTEVNLFGLNYLVIAKLSVE